MYNCIYQWTLLIFMCVTVALLIICDIIFNSLIFGTYPGNWEQYCTGGNFLKKITVFAIINGFIGLISGNTVNIIMLILYYVLHYNEIQQESGDCQTKNPVLYNTVFFNQVLLVITLFMSIPSILIFVTCRSREHMQRLSR